jgi:hypothetical protein
MAMEINSKQLHLHAMPVALILLALVSLITLSVSQPGAYGKALFTSAFHIDRKSNGLTNLSLKDSQSNAIGYGWPTEVGKTAQRYIIFNSN